MDQDLFDLVNVLAVHVGRAVEPWIELEFCQFFHVGEGAEVQRGKVEIEHGAAVHELAVAAPSVDFVAFPVGEDAKVRVAGVEAACQLCGFFTGEGFVDFCAEQEDADIGP